MKQMRFFSILRHSHLMVLRTWKSYALLSVTIVLSFSLLLGYLTFSDSSIYNENKELFSYRREDLRLHISSKNEDRLPLLVNGLSAMDKTAYYAVYNYQLGYSSTDYFFEKDGNLIEITQPSIMGIILPDHSWPEDVASFRHENRRMDIVWLDGEEHPEFSLERDQVILTEALYQLLGMDQQPEPIFQLTLQHGQKIPLRVAGYYKDYSVELWERYREIYSPALANRELFYLVLSNKFIDYAKLSNKDLYGIDYSTQYDVRLDSLFLQVYSETPELVLGLYESICGQEATAIYQLQNDALDEIRPQKQVKAIITCALLLILGVNLYSCFTNALNDRKFEIGVKRALGASAFSIVRQFLYESCIVMAANILLSVSLVTDVAVVYKFIVEHTPDEMGAYPDFILYLSPYSAAMFGICAVSLTIVFSLIFAYKTTRVEIVQYLKAE